MKTPSIFLLLILAGMLSAQQQMIIEGVPTSFEPVLRVNVNYSGNVDAIGLNSNSAPADGFGIGALLSGGSIGAWGQSDSGIGLGATSLTGFGIHAESEESFAIYGESKLATSIVGFSESVTGVAGYSPTGIGVAGYTYDAVPGFTEESLSINELSRFSQKLSEGVTSQFNSSNLKGKVIPVGVLGQSQDGFGVIGTSFSFIGVTGNSTASAGVRGYSEAYLGVWGDSPSGTGVKGKSETSIGVLGESDSNYGIQGTSNSGIGISGQSQTNTGMEGMSNLGIGILGTSASNYAIQGVSTSSNGLRGMSDSGIGIQGFSNSNIAIQGESANTYGVVGISNISNGVRGISESGTGVRGITNTGEGVRGHSNTNTGVLGTSGSDIGVLADGSSYDFYAASTAPTINYGVASSRRWKTNIRNIDGPLDKIALLRGVYFDWDPEHGGNHDIGFIAEEIGKVLPEAVAYEANGTDAHGMDYAKVTPLLVEAVNALRIEYRHEIDTLKKALEEQKRATMELTELLRKMQSGSLD